MGVFMMAAPFEGIIHDATLDENPAPEAGLAASPGTAPAQTEF
jgi:hypothetical protein